MNKKDNIIYFALVIFIIVGIFIGYKSGYILGLNDTYNVYSIDIKEGYSVSIDEKYSSNVTYKSSNEEVAIVENDVIVAKKKGKTEITAYEGNKIVGEYKISVESSSYVKPVTEEKVIEASSIKITNTIESMSVGDKKVLKYKVSPKDATDKSVKWSSSDEEVISVRNGEITAKSEGKAKITVTTSNGKSNTIEIKVKEKTIEVSKIEIINSEEALTVGNKVTIRYKIYPEDASNKNVIWSSSDENIASVKNGEVTAKSEGKAKITVKTKNGKSDTAVINVTEKSIPITSIDILDNISFMYVGDIKTLNYKISPEDATNRNVTWSSSNSNVISVNNGEVTAKGVGSATIKVKTDNGKTDSITIDVKEKIIDAISIEITNPTQTITVGDKYTLKYRINPDNTTDKSVTWTSSNTGILIVNNGVITAKSAGKATITVKTSNSKSASLTIIVKEKPVEVTNITLDKTSSTLFIGNTDTISATIEPSNATDKTITWTSSNTSVATVSNGVIKAVGVGKATITAKCGTKSAKVSVTVYSDDSDRIRVYFLNTQNAPSMSEKNYESNEAVIFKTKDKKYVLFDTGNSDENIKNIIYNRLKTLQGKDNVVIDYLIISHSDGDHYGNAVKIIQDEKIKVNNVVIKYEYVLGKVDTSKKTIFKKTILAAEADGAKIYTGSNMTDNKMESIIGHSVSYTKLSKGKKLSVGSYLNLYFYNVADVYQPYANNASEVCISGSTVMYTSENNSSRKYLKTPDGKYIYYDNTKGDYPNITLKTRSEFVEKKNGYKSYFYAYKSSTTNTCRSNGNSFAVMFEVILENKDSKYIYMPGDLQNQGFDSIPEKYNNYPSKVYGQGTSYLYKDLTFDTSSKKFTDASINVKIAAETDTANDIKADFGDKINNIVIYQETHHGFNNAKDAIDILNLNRSKMITIATCKSDFSTSASFREQIAYNYSLGNVKAENKFRTGNGKNGVYCYIRYNGNVVCKNY